MVLETKGLRAAWVIVLLWSVSLGAAGDVRLVDAVQKGDSAAVLALLKAQVDVNASQPDGASALAWAAHRDDLQTATLLIAAGANVNAANEHGVTPLSLACVNGSLAMVEKLLTARANANSALPSGETALMTCARTGNVETVKSLLARRAEVDAQETRRGQTALMWAVEQKHLNVAQALIQHGANVHARSKGGFTALLFAVQQGQLEMVKILLAAGANVNEATSAPTSAARPPGGTAALLMAAASGHESLALYLLEKGADPNTADSGGTSALHYAMLKGLIMIVRDQQSLKIGDAESRPNMTELTKALLARGANPNARLVRNVGRLPYSMAGATPFMLATISGDIGLMRLLLAHGADPSVATTENTTALMLASGLGLRVDRTPEELKNGLEAVKLLVELGADVNAVGEYQWTALHGTAYSGSDSIAQFLVEKGAELDANDVWKQTPLSIAQGFVSVLIDDFNKKTQGPHPKMAELFLKLGAAPWVPPVRPPAEEPANTSQLRQ